MVLLAIDADESPRPATRPSLWSKGRSVVTAMRFFNTAIRELRPDRLGAPVAGPAVGPAVGPVEATPFDAQKKWKRLGFASQGMSFARQVQLDARAKRSFLDSRNMQALDIQEGKEGEIEYWQEGDKEMNTEEAWKARLKLRSHPAIQEELHRWWEVVRCSFQSGDVVNFVGYARLQLCMYKTLLTPYNEEDAKGCAAAEWKKDCKGAKALDRVTFCDTIFEMVDVWTRSLDWEEYVSWMRTLLSTIAPNGTILSADDLDPIGDVDALVDDMMADPSANDAYAKKLDKLVATGNIGKYVAAKDRRSRRGRKEEVQEPTLTQEQLEIIARRKRRAKAMAIEAALPPEERAKLAESRAAAARGGVLANMAKKNRAASPRTPRSTASSPRDGLLPDLAGKLSPRQMALRGLGDNAESFVTGLTARDALLLTYHPMHTLTSLSPFVLVNPSSRPTSVRDSRKGFRIPELPDSRPATAISPRVECF